MLVARKRIEISATASEFIQLVVQTNDLKVLPISPDIAELSTNLGAEINTDPADRLIVATSILSNAPIITADRNLIESKLVETIW